MTTQTAAATWTATLGQLELAVTRANFDTWLRDTVGLRHEPGRFVVGAQNDFATEWLTTRLRPLIARTLARVLGSAIDVGFEVIRPHGDEQTTPALLPAEEQKAAQALPQAHAPAPPSLNPALTFDAFVAGDENRLALQSARAVAASPGKMNPLTIFGAPGLGKTHLLNAIGHACHADSRNVIYVTAEQFGNDYVRALATKEIERFRARYRGCDVLIVDDIQFLEHKEKFQEEFVHAFNELHQMGRQVVVSAERAPMLLTGLSDALRSRLQWGLAVDLQKPAYETRLAILREKCGRHAEKLPDDALAVIAERCCPTVRELEGYLNRVLAYLPLTGESPTRDAIERALSPFASVAATGATELPDADAIIEAVCRRTGALACDLRGRTRNRAVTYARHLAMYLMKEDARKSIAEIGRAFGNRDHSTVLAGIARIEKDRRNYTDTVADLRALRTALSSKQEDSDGEIKQERAAV
jgi:chromosomal replication initiator protein